MWPDPIRNPILAKHYGSLGPPGEKERSRLAGNENGFRDQVRTGCSITFYLNSDSAATAIGGGM